MQCNWIEQLQLLSIRDDDEIIGNFRQFTFNTIDGRKTMVTVRTIKS